MRAQYLGTTIAVEVLTRDDTYIALTCNKAHSEVDRLSNVTEILNKSLVPKLLNTASF